MLNLICGTSGAGKSRRVLRAISEDIQKGRKCYLLVPEQQAYISERDLFELLPPNAGLYFEIVNFSKLADAVFHRFGGYAAPSAGSGARSVLVWNTMRQLAPLLQQYGKSKIDASITAEMFSTLQELQSNGIEPDQLRDVAGSIDEKDPLHKKLLDLELIYATYLDQASTLCGLGPSDRILKAAELLRHNSFFENCNIYIDSFTSFTVPEYTFLGEILCQASSLTVTLCLDRLNSRKLHFECVAQTATRLERLAKDKNSEIKLIYANEPHEDKPAELCALESGLWDFDLTKKNRVTLPSDAPRAVRTYVCSNLYEESEACAIQILGLIQKGYHYGDIAVVVRDTETYRGVLDAALERYHIPYFLSERTDLASKPLSRLILSALRTVSQGYRMQDVMTLLKTGLSGADMRRTSLFEEYCETWHITGKRFLDDAWSMNPDGLTTEKPSPRGLEILTAANEVREIVIKPLQLLQSEIRAAENTTELCRAIYQYLCRLNVREQLAHQAQHELELGQKREAGETVRLYDFVVESLTQLVYLLPDTKLTVDEFLSVLTLYFSVTDLGSVPAAHDCVVIGSADTLRIERVKASFLLGLCEGEFPAAISDRGLFTESDKQAMGKLGLTLQSGQKTRFSEELFYVYRAMTKPSERLFLSYPSMQTDGSERTPSMAFRRVEFLLDRSPEIITEAYFSKRQSKTSERPLIQYQLPDMGANVRLHLSQSSIHTFALCPYSYYSSHALKLRGKKDSNVSAADEGTFLHFVFEKFLKRSLDENGRLRVPSPEQIPEIADDTILEYFGRACPVPPESMDGRLLHLFERLRGLAILILREIVGELSCSRFRPVGFEQKLGGCTENALPAVRLALKDGCSVELHGTVDRVDVLEKDGKLYVRIVDYKTGEREFKFEKVKTGEEIQLILYLFAVVSSDPDHYVPCGGEFLFSKKEKGTPNVARSGFLLDDEEVRSAADCADGQPYLKKLCRSSAERLNESIQDMQTVVCEIAQRILAGEAQKTPSEEACRFCEIREHCDVACHSKQ